jgi:ubiquinol-cytochrome c reductase cytochrome b subunit
MRLLLFAAVGTLALSSFALASSRSQRTHGAAVFSGSGCQHCHSIGGVGGHKGPDLSGVGRRKSKAEMRQQIVYGSKVMPAFGDDLEPNELKDLIAYLKSCRQKPATTPQTSASN